MKSFSLFLYVSILSSLLLLVGCEQEITVELPEAESKIVVEGSIENGQPPLVQLTWSQGYFDPINLNTLSSLYINDAIVTVSNGTETVTLDPICSSDLTPEQLQLASEFLGLSIEVLQSVEICIYTTFNPVMIGETGKTYTLTVEKGEHYCTAQTKINELVFLDSLWFQNPANNLEDSLGFIYGTITDPDTTGNAYRWFAQRVNKYPDWVEDEELRGQQKDGGYIAPLGSVFDDAFFNGLNFEFAYYRGSNANSIKFDDLNEERGYFKRGDTVAVKGCVIDRGAYNFFFSFESQISNQGSPFALPYNVESNINGGLGVWVGYGAIYDTVICQY